MKTIDTSTNDPLIGRLIKDVRELGGALEASADEEVKNGRARVLLARIAAGLTTLQASGSRSSDA